MQPVIETETVDGSAVAHGNTRPNGSGDPIFVRRLALTEFDEAMQLTREQLNAHVASEEVIRRVLAHNADSVWAIFREGHLDAPPRLSGFYSMLLLNQDGLDALREGLLYAAEPSTHQLARAGERPAAIYAWAVVARRLLLGASPLIARAMGPLYTGVPIFTRAATEDGMHSILRSRYQPVDPNKRGLGALYWLPAYPSQETRNYSVLTKAKRKRCVAVIPRTLEDLTKVIAIRSAVFIAEQSCPYSEEFDGNDLSCTHVLGLVDGEPAGVMRIRYFAEFAKLERLAVLPRFRRTRIIKELVSTSVEFCRRKGYTRLYGHAQTRYVELWKKLGFGFTEMPGRRPLVFSDFSYVEMYGELTPHPDRLTLQSDPYVLLRPEGVWDEPGPLDLSALRPVAATTETSHVH